MRRKFGGEKIHYSVYTKIIDKKKYYLSSGLNNPKKNSEINKIIILIIF